MKKIIALMLALLMLCACTAGAEEFAAEFDTEFRFDGDVDMVYVSSFDEAAELYAGEIPAFTAPEGFYLTEVLVDSFGLTAYYSSLDPAAEEVDDEAEPLTFEFSMYDYGKEEGVSHYTLQNGALTEASASMVTLYEDEGLIYSADVHTIKGDIYFSFEGLDRAQVEAVLTALVI